MSDTANAGDNHLGRSCFGIGSVIKDGAVDGYKKVLDNTLTGLTGVSDTVGAGFTGVKDATMAGVGGLKDATAKGASAVNEPLKFVTDPAKEIGLKTAGVIGDQSKMLVGGVESRFKELGAVAGFQNLAEGLVGGAVDKSDEGLAKQFAAVDTDGSGKISGDEMKAAIHKSFGSALDDDMFSQMMKAADTDGDGEIDLDEFKAIMRAGPESKPGIGSSMGSSLSSGVMGFKEATMAGVGGVTDGIGSGVGRLLGASE